MGYKYRSKFDLAFEINTSLTKFYTLGGWSENSPELFIGYTSLYGFDNPVDLAVYCLANIGFRWGIGSAPESGGQIYRKTAENSFDGKPPEAEYVVFSGTIVDIDLSSIADEKTYQDMLNDSGSMIIGLRIGKMSAEFFPPSEALQRIEVHEGTIIPTEICYALMKAWDATESHKEIADMDVYRSYLNMAINAGISGIHKFVFPAKEVKFAEVPISQTKINRIALELLDNFFDITKTSSLQEKMTKILEMYNVIRPTDYARIFMNLGKILSKRSDSWYSKPDVIRFAQDHYAEAIAPIINIAAVEYMITSWPTENFGYGDVYIGDVSVSSYDPFRAMYEPDYLELIGGEPMLYAVMMAVQSAQATRLSYWLQLMELKAGGISPEIAKNLFGNLLMINATANSDSDMNFSEDTITLLNEMALAFTDDAAKNACFVPYGVMRVDVPRALRDVLVNTKYKKSELFNGIQLFRKYSEYLSNIGDVVYCPYRLYIYVSPDGLWVRPKHIDGRFGFIFEWRPDQPMRKMLFSKGNYAFYNAMLAGIWRDLRVQGNNAFPQNSNKIIPETMTEFDFDERFNRYASKDTPPRSSYRNLPRKSVSGEMMHIYGDVEWGDQADHEIINHRMHGVSGHSRLLPNNHKASEKAFNSAKQYGIILPSNGRITFVKPHVRGKHTGEDNTFLVDVVVKAQALATLATLDLIHPTATNDEVQE